MYNATGNKLFRHDIHHKEWNLEEIDIPITEINYNFNSISLNKHPEKLHYCQSIDVLLWSRKRIL
ncbi:hypothetical protein [Flavobacterium sp. DG2-3]|uniref:hypothetical protein n=1 Tax=Flavobacterium sp. DG2-3 TaxID=3068317 RepID=UPI0035310120